MSSNRDPFRINRYDFSPNAVDDLIYLVRYSYSRIRTLLGGTSSASELEIHNGICELVIELRRKMANLGAVYQLRRRLSLHTDPSSSESYCEAAKAKFLEILKAGHPGSAHEFYEEFEKGIDFSDEIKEGFLHLCTEPMPALYITRIQGDLETEELLTPEHWDTSYALKVYSAFRGHIDFQPLCQEAIAHLQKDGRHEDVQVLYNAFKNKVQLPKSPSK